MTCIATAILITYATWDAGLLSVYMFTCCFANLTFVVLISSFSRIIFLYEVIRV